MHTRHSQKGATLVLALIMLTVLALLGVTSVNNSTVNLRVTQNTQARLDIEADAQNVIEQVIGDIAPFDPPAAQTIAVDDYRTVTVAAPECTNNKPSSGYSATYALAPVDTQWEVTTTVNDPVTGSRTTMRQGVQITMVAGSCT